MQTHKQAAQEDEDYMKQDNFKAPLEPPIEKDDNNVYNFKCEKCDTKYRSVVILRIHETKQHTGT